jgi:hypothetical protein
VRAQRDLPGCSTTPTEPWNPTPASGASGVSVNASLVWSEGSSTCPGLTATHDVYFGTVNPPPLDHDNGSVKNWKPSSLANNTTYYWQIVAKDDNGQTPGQVWSFTTESAPCTLPPAAVVLTAPANNATGVSIGQDLSWGGGASRCTGLTSSFDVYFGASNPPPFDHNNATATLWDPGNLDYGTTYYWRIVAKDANGETASATRSFATEYAPCTQPPGAVTLTTPGNAAGGVSVQADLSWTGGTSQCLELSSTYDVYFGTVSPPPLDHINGAAQSWDPGELEYNTTYYWRIVAKDGNGSTTSTTRSFTTESAPCVTPPAAVTLTSPANNATGVSIQQDIAWSGGASQCVGLSSTYDVYFGTVNPPDLQKWGRRCEKRSMAKYFHRAIGSENH